MFRWRFQDTNTREGIYVKLKLVTFLPLHICRIFLSMTSFQCQLTDFLFSIIWRNEYIHGIIAKYWFWKHELVTLVRDWKNLINYLFYFCKQHSFSNKYVLILCKENLQQLFIHGIKLIIITKKNAFRNFVNFYKGSWCLTLSWCNILWC